MTIRAKLISLFWSSDFWVGFGAAALYIIAAPDQVTLIAAKDILSICVSVLAIVFSVFFAAVAIVMTAGDNEFVLFLEKKGMYTHIIWTFQATLVLLLVALIASISFYIALLLTPNPELDSTLSVSKWLLAPLLFMAAWAIFAAYNSSHDAIRYATYRAQFVQIQRNGESTKSEEEVSSNKNKVTKGNGQ